MFKYLRQGSPTSIPHQGCLLLVGGFALLRVQRLEEPDGRDIGPRFLMQPARTNAVCFGYAEVSGGLSLWLSLVESDSSAACGYLLIIGRLPFCLPVWCFRLLPGCCKQRVK